jgi:membrane protease YdiL (CAAX protease family)
MPLRPPAPDSGPRFHPAVLLEALLLYCILFLPGALAGESPREPAVFSISRELTRIIAYNLPALVLIWYLWRKTRPLPLPFLGDLWALLWAFPSLILTGVSISMAAARFPGQSQGPAVVSPGGIPGLAFMFLSCLSTGYLEESYFRYYLGEKIREMGLASWMFMLISTALFSLCHLYEGPWGMMNSMLAALILGLIYIRFRSLHGLALAHGLYNAVVYLLSLAPGT